MTALPAEDVRRIVRVLSAGHLCLAELAFWCGRSETKLREWIKRPDFPRASDPDQNGSRLWSKAEVDEWMDAHKLESDD